MIVPAGVGNTPLFQPFPRAATPLLVAQRLDSPEFHCAVHSRASFVVPTLKRTRKNTDDSSENGPAGSGADGKVSGKQLELPLEKGEGGDQSDGGVFDSSDGLRCSASKKKECLTLGPFWPGPLFNLGFVSAVLDEVKASQAGRDLSSLCSVGNKVSLSTASMKASSCTPRGNMEITPTVGEVNASSSCRTSGESVLGAQTRVATLVKCENHDDESNGFCFRGPRKLLGGEGGKAVGQENREAALVPKVPNIPSPSSTRKKSHDWNTVNDNEKEEKAPSCLSRDGTPNTRVSQGNLPSSLIYCKRRCTKPTVGSDGRRHVVGARGQDRVSNEGLLERKRGEEGVWGCRSAVMSDVPTPPTTTSDDEPLKLSSRRQLIFLLEALEGELVDCPLFYSLTDVAGFAGGWQGARGKGLYESGAKGRGGGGGRGGVPLPSVDSVRVRIVVLFFFAFTVAVSNLFFYVL